ncbi:MAG TPA: CRTAC1 family protein [Candidatus Deferrimicrobium sp.]|nr:CRTAC1 family protein [Candidatus Deferrimicrobium sp.]
MNRRTRLVYITGLLSLLGTALVIYLVVRRNGSGAATVETSSGITQVLKRELPQNLPSVQFVDVSEQAGIVFHHFNATRSSLIVEDMGSGAAWGDYDGDGDLDLYVVNFAGSISWTVAQRAQTRGNALFRNRGDGTFEDVAEQAGVDTRVWGMGAQWGDYDGDGDLDLYVTCYGPNILFRNHGDGTFRDVTAKAGVGDEGFSTGAAWSDYDRDGDLDLYVANYVEFRPGDTQGSAQSTYQYQMVVPYTLNPSSYEPAVNRLYRNNGNGTFAEVARQSDVHNPTGRSLAATFCDFNNDGLPDIYVANDVSANAMYQNVGKGRFIDISASSWAADYRGAMGLAVGDYDNDLDLDIFLTHWIAQENALYSNMLVEFSGMGSDSLRFRDVADAVGLGEISLDFVGWGTEFFDLDNDGRLDLFVVNGSTFEDPADRTKLIPQENMLFWNRGDSGYFNIAGVVGASFPEKNVGRGAALADYDDDGDVDIFVQVHNGRARLLRNDGTTGNHWLKVQAVGRRPNTHAIGTKLRIVAGDKSQIREIGAGNSYLSQNSLEAEFGLGTHARIDLMVITWPSGDTDTLTDVACDQTLRVVEGKVPAP